VLHECLITVTQLLAPMCPFVADAMFQNLAATSESVHLSDWPAADESAIDPALEEDMARARHVVSLGLAARTESRLKVRQPLARALVLLPGHASISDDVQAEISDALNVKQLETVTSLEGLLDYTVVPNFRRLGPKVGKLMPKLKEALTAADGATIRRALDTDGGYDLTVEDGTTIRLDAEDVDVRATSHEELALAEDGGLAVALDTRIDRALELEGLAREVIRLLNDHRKARGLEISDRIVAWLQADGPVSEAVAGHRDWIAGEVLARELHLEPSGSGNGRDYDQLTVGSATVGVSIEKA
jgi:isoleucyl-tRNA synthetase